MTVEYHQDAEEHVLAAMIDSPSALQAAIDVLEPEGERKFYLGSHGMLYALVRGLRRNGTAVDWVTVGSAAHDPEVRNRLNVLRGWAGVPANVRHHAEIVRRAWVKRTLQDKFLTLASSPDDGEALLRNAEDEIVRLRTHLAPTKKTVVSAAAAAEWFEKKMLDPLGEPEGVKAPFSFLQRLAGSRLYVLGGYQKDGKTVCGVQFVRAAAGEDGLLTGGEQRRARVGVASLEMSWSQMTDRIVASYGVPYAQAETGGVVGPGRVLAQTAVAQMKQWSVDIIDDPVLDIGGLRRYQRLGGYDLLVVDHLHRFGFTDRRDMERIVQGITNLARDFAIPVVLLAQLSRSGDPKHPFPVPTTSSLRETAVIEQEAAAVWFIYRKRDPETHRRMMESEFIVAANRFGDEGAFPLWFKPAEVRFDEKEGL